MFVCVCVCVFFCGRSAVAINYFWLSGCTNYQSPCYANSCSASREFSYILWSPKVHCRIYNTEVNLWAFKVHSWATWMRFTRPLFFLGSILILPPVRLGIGDAVAQWLRCCATNRKVAGSIPDGVIGIFHWHNPSDRTLALGSTQPLTEMSTRIISWGWRRPVRKAWQPYHQPVPLS